jgi:hypothetical protein
MPRRTERPLEKVSIFDLRRRITALRAVDFSALADDAIRTRIGFIIHDFPFQPRPLVLSGVYRARVNRPGELFTDARQLWHPPAERVTRPGRLNRPGQVLFYAASMPNTAIYELRAVPGDVVTVLLARTRRAFEQINATFIGLERARAPELAGFLPEDRFRTSSNFRASMGEGNYRKFCMIDDYLSEIFARPVADGAEHLYKPCIALGDWLFTMPKLDAVNYPSVATNDYGVNICMLPARADAILNPSEAWMIALQRYERHPATGEVLTRVDFLRRSHEIGPDGAIVWRDPGRGLDPASIWRFARRRVENFAGLATPDVTTRALFSAPRRISPLRDDALETQVLSAARMPPAGDAGIARTRPNTTDDRGVAAQELARLACASCRRE